MPSHLETLAQTGSCRWSNIKSATTMVRVVCPGGTVATYAWDMLGGGFPLEPIQAEMRAMGLTPVLPPSSGASRMDALRSLWTGAGLEGRELYARHRREHAQLQGAA